VGDFNGDGKPDLAVANVYSDNVNVLLGNGDGTFQAPVNYAAGSGPASVAVGDLNGDGKPDLAVSNSSGINVLLGNGDGAFQATVFYAAGSGPDFVAVGDSNGDSKPDLAVANQGSNNVTIFLNTTPDSAKAATSTTLTSSLNPSIWGQTVTFTATVTPSAGSGIPTGTVTFKDGAITLGSGMLNGSGQATFATTALSAGGHSITAQYAGTGIFAASVSSPVLQSVGKAGTATTLNSSPNPSTPGQTVTFVAIVTGQYGGAVTGTVTFKQGQNKVLGTASLVNGSATLSLSTLRRGRHKVTAVHGGDANSNGSTSPAITQTVRGEDRRR